MVAGVVGVLAAALSVALGVWEVGLASSSVLYAVLTANLAGYFGLLATLTLERRAWARRHLMNRSLKAWAVFCLLSFGPFYAMTPALRDWHVTRVLLPFLVLSNGLMIPLFGVTQDAIVARAQRKARKPASSQGDPQARREGGARRSIPVFARAAWDVISFKSSN